MKKKVMSEAALKNLFADESPEAKAKLEADAAAAAGEGAGPLPDGEGEPNAEAIAAAEAAAEATAKELAEGKQEDEAKELAELVQAEFDEFKIQTEAQLETLTAELAAANEKYATDLEKLKGIVVGQVTKMRTALSLAAVDMAEWKVDAVIEEYDSTKEAFMKALPVGSVIPEKDTKKAENPVSSSLDASNIKSLGF